MMIERERKNQKERQNEREREKIDILREKD